MRAVALKIKRVLDVSIAAATLIILSPVMLVISLLIKLESPGPVLFIQERVGRDGRPFHIRKFRSMVVNADKSGMVTRLRDPRVTTVGRVIRLTSLDELPQLFNVFTGDMSLVGPRALLPGSIKPEEMRRQSMRPGVTSLPIVSGRQRLDWERRIELDLWYVDHWSLWLDLKIILKTLWVVLLRKDVYDADGEMKPRAIQNESS